MREAPPIHWRAVLTGGAAAVVVSLLLSVAHTSVQAGVAGAVAVGAFVAGRSCSARPAFHGGLVAVLWILAEALADPLRPAPTDALSDTALTVVGDAALLGGGILFGWLGGLARRR